MHYNYPYYGVAGGAAIGAGYYPVAETRDQFIRRYVLERAKAIGSYHHQFINEARSLWDESFKTEKK